MIINFSVESHNQLTDSECKDIKDGDELTLRLKEVHGFQYKIGKPSYIPITEQTEKGLAKFYAILKYLVSYNISFMFD